MMYENAQIQRDLEPVWRDSTPVQREISGVDCNNSFGIIVGAKGVGQEDLVIG